MPLIVWVDDNKVYKAYYNFKQHRIAVFRIVGNKDILVLRKNQMTDRQIKEFVWRVKEFEEKK